MRYITYEGQVYQYLPGGKRYIYQGEYFEDFGQVLQWKEPYKTFAPAWRVIPIQRVDIPRQPTARYCPCGQGYDEPPCQSCSIPMEEIGGN